MNWRYSFLLLLLSALLFANHPPVDATNGLPCSRAHAVYLPWVQQETAALQPPTATTLRTGGRATVGAPLVLTPDEQTLWVVNPDAGSLTALATATAQKQIELTIGGEPWALALAPDGQRLYVLDRSQGRLLAVNLHTQQVTHTLLVGGEPGMVVLSPSGAYAFITSAATGEVLAVDIATFALVARWQVSPQPYAIAMSDDGDLDDWDETVVVTHLTAVQRPGGQEATDDGRQGEVTLLYPCQEPAVLPITLAPDDQGFPSLLTGIALAQGHAWVTLQRASPALPNTLTQTLFAAVAAVDLAHQQAAPDLALPLNDQTIFGSPINNPWAVAAAPDGKRLYVVAAGSDLVEVIDIAQPAAPQLLKFLPVGLNPRGLVLNQAGTRGYVLNFLGRSVTIIDLVALTVVGEVTVSQEPLLPTVLRGKILFNNASNPKLSRGGWISCASCHPDGGTDNITWIFPDGPRQTPALWNAAATLPWHWSAALDEAQDVESTIEGIQHGLGLAPGAEPPLLGAVNAGRAADLDALAAYLQQGIRPPRLLITPSLTATITTGRQLFQQRGCADCHGGPTWSASHLPAAAGEVDPDQNGMVDTVLRDVGTVNAQDLRGATGFDPPTLLNVGLTAPYFHDGAMPSLAAVIASGHPHPLLGATVIEEKEVIALVTFLRSIDQDTVPISTELTP